MQTGQEDTGMVTLNQSLLELIKKRHITLDTALDLAYEKTELEELANKHLFGPGSKSMGKSANISSLENHPLNKSSEYPIPIL